MLITRPKGTADIYGQNAALWQHIEAGIKETAHLFGAAEIRTPVFENAELFRQSVGEATDIVQKEMYNFFDQGGREYVLKPEATASAVRAYLENSLQDLPAPTKFYYISPIFRAERPQKGRYRQHHQFGAEYFGSYEASADAELISLAHLFLAKLGIKGLTLRINSIGDKNCRKRYNDELLSFLQEHKQNLCALCQDRMEKNPMRVLDCKSDNCKQIIQNAPVPLDFLSQEAEEHFMQLQNHLKALNIPFKIDKNIVRGLDYYTRTVFEFTSSDLGSQSAVCGGGRYDNLIEKNGGKPTGAVGFGMGIERLLIVLEAQGKLPAPKINPDIFIGHIGEAAAIKALQLSHQLRQAGISALTDLVGRTLKAQLKYADKIGAAYSLILGDTELSQNQATLKNMQTGGQTEISLDNIISQLIQ
jgi:histidyl-tRNA synthetase